MLNKFKLNTTNWNTIKLRTYLNFKPRFFHQEKHKIYPFILYRVKSAKIVTPRASFLTKFNVSYFFLSLTDSYRILPHFTDSYRILPFFTDSYGFLPIFTDSGVLLRS